MIRHLRGIDYTLRAAAIATAVILTCAAMQDVLLLVFASVLIACVLRGAANWLHRHLHIGAGWCLVAILLVLVVLVVAGVWFAGPRIGDQAVSVFDAVSQQVRHLWSAWQNHPLVERIIPKIQNEAGSVASRVTSMAPGVASSVLGVGGDLVVIAVTAIFLAAAPRTYVRGFLRLLPPHWRLRGAEVLHALGETLQLWFLGQFADMMVVAVLTGAGLFALGVPLAFTLALIAGLFNFVPYVGALAGAVPAIAVALAKSPQTAAYVAILFAVVQFLEGNVIAPLIQKRTVDLPPALTILSQTILGTVFGIMGLILATPLTAAAMTAVEKVYVETILERPREEER